MLDYAVCHWIVLYTVHFTAFCLGGPFFPGHGVYTMQAITGTQESPFQQAEAVYDLHSTHLPVRL